MSNSKTYNTKRQLSYQKNKIRWNTRRRELYALNRDHVLEERRKQYPKTRLAKRKNGLFKKKKVFTHYGNKCNCCGETNFKFLTIDHINNDGNKLKRKNGQRINGVEFYPRIIKEGFPDKYQLLCMNCNFGKRMNNGICPHKDL